MAKRAEQRPGRLEIRKYPNRRYYDATNSRHVTLEQIYDLVREGHEIRVVDSRTDEEITGAVLAQVMLEHDPPKFGVFPPALLHRLIRANEELVRDFVDRYFSQALMAFFESQRQFEQYMADMITRQSPFGAAGPWMQAMMKSMSPWTGWAGGPPTTARPEEPAPAEPPPATGNDELRRSIRQLEKQLESLRKRVDAGRSGPAANDRE